MDITSFLIGKEVGGGPAPTPTYQDKEITITQNGEQTITADEGYDALSSVDITTNVPQPSGKITITQNGTNIDVSSYATADVNVPSGADLSEYFESTAPLYQNFKKIFKKIPPITFSGTTFYSFFASYDLSAPIPDINAPNITNFSYGFQFSQYNDKLDCSNWIIDTSKIITCEDMFLTTQFTEIDFRTFGEINVNSANLKRMFGNNQYLKKLNLSNFSVSPNVSAPNLTNFLNDCTVLEELDISSLDFTNLGTTTNMFNNVPANCLIYVKDQTQKDWFTTNWPGLTNVQIKA